MNRKKVITGIIIFAFLIGGFFLLKGRNGAVGVEKVDVEILTVQRTIAANGTVKSKQSADLSFPLSGALSSIEVQEGDFVEEGTVLAQLDSYTVWQDVQAAKDTRDIAIRDRELYIENYASNPDAVGGADEYQIGLRRQNELVSKAEAAYQSALGTLNKTTLYAPFTGTIIDISADPSEVVSLGSPFIKIADLEQLLFEIAVDQEDFGLLEEGMPVEITLDAYEDEIFTGLVSKLPYYSKTTETGGSDFAVDILIDPADKPILYGMNGEVDIIIQESAEQTQALIFDSIYTNADGTDFVWVLENGTLLKLPIETGIEGDIYTAVSTPLEGKTIVIPASQDTELQEGMNAKITTGNGF